MENSGERGGQPREHLKLPEEEQAALEMLGYRVEGESWGKMHPVLDKDGHFTGLYYAKKPGGKAEWSGVAVIEEDGRKKIRPRNFPSLEEAIEALAELGKFAETKEGQETLDKMTEKKEKPTS